MKLYRIAVLVSVLIYTAVPNLQAQDITYSKSDKFDFRSGEFSVVGKEGDKLYVYRGSAEGYYLDVYANDMHRLATVILDFIPKRSIGKKFITYPGKILSFYQDSEGSDVVQYAAVLDDAGRLLKGPVEIDRVKSSFLGGRNGAYKYALSYNKEQIVIYGSVTRGDDLNARVIWLDTALKKQYVSEADFTADDFVVSGEGIVNDKGQFFISAYTPNGSKDYADRIWMLSLAAGSKKFEAAEIPLGDLFASGTYMELANNAERIYVGGFYADRKNGNFEGIIYTYYDIATNSFKDFKSIGFSDNLRTAASDRSKKRAFNDFRVRQLIVRNDGGFVMLTEDFYLSFRSSYNQGFGYYSWYYPAMSSTVVEYNYGDILAISCNGEGVPEWNQFIRKNQYSQEDGGLFSSYALINTGGTLGFLFNDFNMSRSKIQLATLDANGKSNVKMLTGFKSQDPDWLPKSGKQVSSKEFVVPCLKRNEICFAKVVF